MRISDSKLSVLALLLAVFAILPACACHFSSAFNDIGDDWDKSKVVEHFGSPTKTRRWRGQDRWIYVFYENRQKYVRAVDFEEGQVVGVTRQNWPYRNFLALEAAENLNDVVSAVPSPLKENSNAVEL